MPREFTFGAWYFIPADTAPSRFWIIGELSSRVEPAKSATMVGTWELVVKVNESGQTEFLVNRRGGRIIMPRGQRPAVPLGRWFHVEVTLEVASDNTGRLTARLDGREVLDLKDTFTANSPYARLRVGSRAQNVEKPLTLYIDDVTVRSADPERPPH